MLISLGLVTTTLTHRCRHPLAPAPSLYHLVIALNHCVSVLSQFMIIRDTVIVWYYTRYDTSSLKVSGVWYPHGFVMGNRFLLILLLIVYTVSITIIILRSAYSLVDPVLIVYTLVEVISHRYCTRSYQYSTLYQVVPVQYTRSYQYSALYQVVPVYEQHRYLVGSARDGHTRILSLYTAWGIWFNL